MAADPVRRTRKGRGAVTNPAGRFESRHVDFSEGDWWEAEEFRRSPSTTVTPEITRGLLCRNDSPDIPFEHSINPYKGCEHGCTYCFARPSHAYIGLSPGLDFETRIWSKPDAPNVLRRELSRRSYRCDVIALGSNTDPYQPAERKARITRSILQVLDEFSHPVTLVTKSSLIVRDIDLLSRLAKRHLAHVLVSVTTLDPGLARKMEPRAASPARRLKTIRALADAGVPTGVLVSPVIPGLTDSEIDGIVAATAEAGARWAGTILLRLPGELKGLFLDWLEEAVPTKARHVVSLIRQTRGGNLYEGAYGTRMRGTGPYAGMIQQRFEAACRRHGLDGRPEPLDTTSFAPPKDARSAPSRQPLDPTRPVEPVSPARPVKTNQLSLFPSAG